MKTKEIKEFRENLSKITIAELKSEDFLEEFYTLHLSMTDLLNLIKIERKPVCIKEK